MTTLIRFDPWREMLSLRDAMNQLFEQSFVSPTWFGGAAPRVYVPINVWETEQGYQVQAYLPGLKPEEIDLTVQGQALTIKGSYPALVEEGKQVNWLLHEIGSGAFERTITFGKPVDADHISTAYEAGVLTIMVPVAESSRVRKISITAGQPKQLADVR
jgi:HSP20 family protein